MMPFLLWILTSLTSISVVGDYPYWALLLAGLGGIAFGLNALLDYSAKAISAALPDRGSNPDALRRFVARYGWLLDLAASLLLVFPTRWMVVGFLLVLVSSVLRWWAHGRIIHRTVLDLPILALMLMVPISLWASADLSVSLVPLGQIVAGVNVFYAISARVRTERDLWWAVGGLIALGVFISLVAPFGVEWSRGKLFALSEVYSHFVQVLPKGISPNLLAGALVLVFPIGTAVFLYAPLLWLSPRIRRIGRAALALGLGAILVMLLLSQSRGGIAATLIGVVLLFAFKGRWAVGALMAALGGAGIFLLTRIDPTHLVDLFFSTDAISGLAGREEVWSRAIYALQDVPFTGIGLGIFARALQVLYPLFLAGPDADIPHAHNLYLQVGVDLGIPGLVAYFAVLTLGLVLAARVFLSARKVGHADISALALGLGISLIAIMLHGLVDVVVWDSKPAIMAWALWGLLAVLDRIEAARTQADGSERKLARDNAASR